ncbi:MAG: hypothetical protein NUV50_03220 [Rhodospirillales bacterium]|nr:hypothetical protein [Rhodospirillales bacterium]
MLAFAFALTLPLRPGWVAAPLTEAQVVKHIITLTHATELAVELIDNKP